MALKHIRRLPVEDQGRIVGIITARDLVEATQNNHALSLAVDQKSFFLFVLLVEFASTSRQLHRTQNPKRSHQQTPLEDDEQGRTFFFYY